MTANDIGNMLHYSVGMLKGVTMTTIFISECIALLIAWISMRVLTRETVSSQLLSYRVNEPLATIKQQQTKGLITMATASKLLLHSLYVVASTYEQEILYTFTIHLR